MVISTLIIYVNFVLMLVLFSFSLSLFLWESGSKFYYSNDAWRTLFIFLSLSPFVQYLMEDERKFCSITHSLDASKHQKTGSRTKNERRSKVGQCQVRREISQKAFHNCFFFSSPYSWWKFHYSPQQQRCTYFSHNCSGYHNNNNKIPLTNGDSSLINNNGECDKSG